MKEIWKISSLGEVKFCVGISITLNHNDHTVSLSQVALIDKVIPVWSTRCISVQFTHGPWAQTSLPEQKGCSTRKSRVPQSSTIPISCWLPNLLICQNLTRYRIHHSATIPIPQHLHICSLECSNPGYTLLKRNSGP